MMGLKQRTELVPELGETCYEDGAMWLCFGTRMVLHLGQGEMGLAHFGDAIYDGPDKVGWSMSGFDYKLTIEPGYRLEQIKRPGDDLSVFPTPLGDAFLFCVVKEQT